MHFRVENVAGLASPSDLHCSRVVLLPRRPIRAGEPLTVDYGFNRSSLDLMADYGFVTTANPHDGWLGLPGAEKLPNLEVPRLQAAARALQRQRRRMLKHQQQQLLGQGEAAGDGATVATEAPEVTEAEAEHGQELEEEGDGEEDGVSGREEVILAGEVEADTEADASFSGRLSAAVSLLSPRYGSPGAVGGGGGSFSTPATQRIIAGLWHKLVRHTADGFPTSLEQDRRLLYDIEAGRVSGFGAGLALQIDPGPLQARQQQRLLSGDPPGAGASPGSQTEGERGEAVQGTASATAAVGQSAATSGGGGGGDDVAGRPSGIAAGPPTSAALPVTADCATTARAAGGAAASEDIAPAAVAPAGAHGHSSLEAPAPPDIPAPRGLPAPEAGAAGPAAAEAAGPAHCRTGRRAGRLYAAVRARLEHKELLAVAEELLLEYGRG